MTTAVEDRMRGLADQLQAAGAITTDRVHHAFATVPRHHTVTWYLQEGERVEVPQDQPLPDRVLDTIYSDNALPTVRAHGDQPDSGGSQASLVARMIEALDLKPGMRVLEIGAGTGYNAALIATITGAEVVTIEAGDEAAAGAADTINRLGMSDQVTVLHRDGYNPKVDGQFDRIVVTVGVAGVPPVWLDLLTPNGWVLAPVAHGGYHPAMSIARDGMMRPVLWCDFMPAVGPMRPASLFPNAHRPEVTLPAVPQGREEKVFAPLTEVGYHDLWFYLGAHDLRTTRAYADHPLLDPSRGLLALVDDPTQVVWVQQDGTLVHTGDTDLLARAHQLLTSWSKSTPRLRDWESTLTMPRTDDRLWVPGLWQVAR